MESRPLTFKAQFSWKNDALMNMCARGQLRGRIIVQILTKQGHEDVDILGGNGWRMDGDILIIEDVMYTEGVKFRPLASGVNL